ncbi:phage tail tape measure protein [bacterium RCC_150]
MSFLPPVVMEIRANAAQFLSEQGKVVASAKATATETEKAAQKQAASARAAAAEAQRAAEQQALAADTAAKAVVVATDKRVAAEAKATEAQAKAAQMQADSLGVMTKEQQAAYDKQVAAAERAANAVTVAAAKEAQAQDKAAASAAAAASAQTKAADLQVAAAEKTAAAQEVSATRTKVAMGSVVGVANKISAASVLAGAAVTIGATEMASKFEKSTMLLVTAGGESMSALAGVRKGILDISTQTGTSAEQMSEGMYIMEKAGYRGAAGLAALKAAAEGAKDENVDLATMSQAVTDVLLDYGYKMDTAAHATDSSVRVTNMLVAASGAAKTTMTDFAGSMSAVIPIASTAKISFDQIGGAIATMTQHGQSAQQSSQNLANLVQSLVRPNNLASAAMSQLGIDTTDLAEHLSDRGLSGSLKIVSDAILNHMGPDGMVLQKTMKDNANATAAMQKIIAQMPPSLAEASKGLLDGSTTIKQYTKDTKDYGGTAGALGTQLLGLYKANSGVNDQLKAGKPAIETYNAAMRDVFGNVTAARAATMLLMNDSHEFEANIKAIGDAGKKTGQDISTWADMQSTLSVQLDQTKQMAANFGIELGSKLIPVAKDALKGATDLFHGFEQGNPVLLGVAGVIGGALTISAVNFGIQMGKTVVKTVTGLIEMATTAVAQSVLFVKGMFANEVAVQQFSTKAEIAGSKVRGMGGAIGGIGAVATGAVIGLDLIAQTTNHATNSVDAITKALVNFADAGNTAGKVQMDALFSNWDTMIGHTKTDVSSLDGAMHDFLHQDFNATANHFFDPLNKMFGMATSEAGQFDDKMKGIGDSLGQMVQGGSVDTAAKSFDGMAMTWTKQGGKLQDLIDKMPGYKQALTDSAAAAGVQLSQQEQLDYAMGKVPQKMLDAMSSTQKYTDATGKVKPITPELQKSLEAAGVSADGLANDLGKVLDGMLATGMATISTRDATSKFNKAFTDAQGAVQGLIDQKVDISNALNQNATDFNLTTDAGQQLNAKLEDVMKTGIDMAKSVKGNDSDAQKQIQGDLEQTYTNLVKAADGMGIHGQAAVDLTRKLLGIPPNVDVKTWMDSAARAEADKLKGSVDNIPKDVPIFIHLSGTDQIAAASAALDALRGNANVTAAQIATAASLNHLQTPLGYTGGAIDSIMGMWDGGIIPGTPPSRPNVDNILAMVDGRPLKVRSGEFLANEPATKTNLPWLKAINSGMDIGKTMQSRFVSGFAHGAAQAAPAYAIAGPSRQAPNVIINAQTNATPDEIANAMAWKLRTT